jgi:hypothetical protein
MFCVGSKIWDFQRCVHLIGLTGKLTYYLIDVEAMGVLVETVILKCREIVAPLFSQPLRLPFSEPQPFTTSTQV